MFQKERNFSDFMTMTARLFAFLCNQTPLKDNNNKKKENTCSVRVYSSRQGRL